MGRPRLNRNPLAGDRTAAQVHDAWQRRLDRSRQVFASPGWSKRRPRG